MSNEVNTQKFYKFLSNYQTEGKTWVDVADGDYGNDDGTVIKSEFRKFLNAEWNGEENGELTNDLINTFWKKIDTNTSASKIKGTKLRNLNALDKDETANLDKKLEAYVKLNEFVANNVKIPNVLTSTGSQWKWDVVDELTVLVENFVISGETGDIESILAEAYPAIANKNTAIYCAVEYQNILKSTILADYPDYKVADDNTLKSILGAYTVDANAKPEDIRNDIRAIVDAYFATAGLGDDSAYDLSDLGYTQDENSALNDIQKTVLTKAIEDNLAAIKKEADYDKYPEIFDSAMQTFIDNKLATATFGTFEELKTVGVAEFKTTNEYKNIQNQIIVDRNFRNIDENSGFYKALVLAFGEEFAQTIAKDGRYLKNENGENVYTAILDKVQSLIAEGQFVKNGQIDLLEVQDYIIDQISKNLNTFFPNGYGDMDIEALNKMYDKRAEAASNEEDDEVSLSQHRQAAIDYCDALSKKTTALAKAVNEVFGADYKNVINEMYPSEIATKMTELKAKALEIGESSGFKLKWNSNVANGNCVVGGKFQTDVSANITQKNGSAINQSRISYTATVTSGDGNASVDGLGTLTISAGKQQGYINVKVITLVDGEPIGEREITITVKSFESILSDTTWGRSKASLPTGEGKYSDGDGGLRVWGGTGKYNDNTLRGANISFADLYNGKYNIELGTDAHEKYGTQITSRLLDLGNTVVESLAGTGLDKDILKKAVNNVVTGWVNSVTSVGKVASEGCNNAPQRRNSNGTYVRMSNKLANGEYTGIIKGTDTKGNNQDVYMINFKQFVDAILAEYQKLV